MKWMIELILLGGFVHVILVGANVVLPRVLQPATELAPASPMIRKMFYVHWIYLVFVLAAFAAMSFLFAPEMASGRGLGRFLSATIAVFWLARVLVQFFYYPSDLRRANRLQDVLIILAFSFLGAVYAAAAVGAKL